MGMESSRGEVGEGTGLRLCGEERMADVMGRTC